MEYLVFIIGIILGSFYLVVATRLPKHEDIIFSRSHCDNCKETLKWYQLIPIVSFFIFRGKCPKCRNRIPLLNLIVEICTGLMFLFMYYRYGISYEFFAGLVISSLVIIIFISDFKYYIILDSPLIIASLIILGLKIGYFGLVPAMKAFLSGITLFIVMYLVGKFGNKVFKKESLGGGDIKLAGVIGIILGFRLGLLSLMLSSFLALPISLAAFTITKNNEVPFGPFLIGALLVIFVFMEKFSNLIALLFSL